MASQPVPLGDLVNAARTGSAPPWPAWPPILVRVDLDGSETDTPTLPAWWPGVVVGVMGADGAIDHPACDAVVGPDGIELAAIEAAVEANPLASTALAMLLRGSASRAVPEGLLAESAVYSALQAGPEFATWRAANPPRPREDRGERVRVERLEDTLHVTLVRAEVRNALDTAMRDQLVAALELAVIDGSIAEVHLRGEGPAFCAGGDLDEFGSRPDPATAHLVRVLQSAGRAMDVLAERVTAHVHGACRGSGVEIPAFARHVVAAPDTTFGLPEISLGLIPGAGGTVSLPRRIGRHRTALLALTGLAIDAARALEWGLVDELGG